MTNNLPKGHALLKLAPDDVCLKVPKEGNVECFIGSAVKEDEATEQNLRVALALAILTSKPEVAIDILRKMVSKQS